MKTKELFKLTLLVLMALLGTLTASAYDFSAVNAQGETLYYNLTSSNTVEVTYPRSTLYARDYYNGINLVIPSSVEYNGNTYTVTGIRAHAFDEAGITSIELPNTITSIGEFAFWACSNLNSLNIPENVSSIGIGIISTGNHGWSPLNSVKTLYYNAKHAVGDHIYWDTGLINVGSDCNVIIGENVEHIPNHFLRDSEIQSIHIPSSVTSIGEYAFSGCAGLTSITLPSSITSIGVAAFQNCTGIKTVVACMTAPPAIVSTTFSFRTQATLYVPAGCLPNYAMADYWREFNHIIENSRITFADPRVEALCVNRWDTNGDGYLDRLEAAAVTVLGTVFSGNTQITSFNELQYFTGLATIQYNAFKGCTNLTSITVPEFVTSIKDHAFENCYNLSNITLPADITSIGASAFANCSHLSNLSLPAVTSIGTSAFYNCTGLNSVSMPAVTTIDATAFYGCSNLSTVNGLGHASSIGESAFLGCSRLTEASINCTTIETNAFAGCTSLASVTLGNNVGNIKDGAFKNCRSLTAINIPGSVITISGGFEGCSTLASVTLNTGTKYIVTTAFKDCSALTSIQLPNTLVYLGESAFQNTGLTVIDIPASVTTITGTVFKNCSYLKTVIVHWTTPITVDATAFPNRANQWLSVPEGTKPAYQAADIWKDFEYILEPGNLNQPYALFTADNSTLTFYCDGQLQSHTGKLYMLNNGDEQPDWMTDGNNAQIVKVVFDDSFANCQPTSTAHWFEGMTRLNSITGLDVLNTSEVTNMYAMFKDCSKLTEIYTANFNTAKVTTMAYMFSGCSSLTRLNLTSFNTAAVTDMSYMFNGCSKLVYIYAGIGWTTENVTSSENMFKSCGKLVGGMGTTYDPYHVDEEYAHLDGGPSNPGYLTDLDDYLNGPYVLLSSDSKTLTFYDDGQMQSHQQETTYKLPLSNMSPEWSSVASGITSVVFDASFTSARPVKTQRWFYGMTQLTSITGIENLNTSEATNMASMFENCAQLTSLDLSHFDTHNVTRMDNMFYECTGLTSLDLSSFDTQNVTTMSYMFRGCSGLTSLDLSSFDTHNVTSINYMFRGCSGLTSLDVTGFDTRNVRYMNGLFRGCSGLTSIDLSNFDTQKVMEMSDMFAYCTALSIIDLSRFNTPNLSKTGSMFNGCSGLTTILADEGWTTNAVTSSSYMFTGCTNLVGGMGTVYDASHVDKAYAHIDEGSSNPGYFTGLTAYAVLSTDGKTLTFYRDGLRGTRPGMKYDLNEGANNPGWYSDNSCRNVTTVIIDTSFADARPTSTCHWFDGMYRMTRLIGLKYLNTSEVTNMRYMFGSYSMPTLDLSHFDTGKVTDMSRMFASATLTSLDLSSFDTGFVTDMSYMFSDCSALESIDLSSFNTINVTNMNGMFYECSELTEIDLGNFNTSSVTSMVEMFFDCCNLTSLDLSSFDTHNVTSMMSMFIDCNHLASVDLSNFNTANVTNMNSMFGSCYNLTSLDLSSFDTHSVTDMSSMFDSCRGLVTAYVGNEWNTAAVTNSSGMFSGCVSIIGGKGTTYDANHTDKAYAHVDRGTSNPGYFSSHVTFLRGDVNDDGQVKISDVTALINYLLSGDASAINLDAADCNQDGQVKISDVTTLINYLLSGTW